ncbi:MAG: autotransporter-associated beta strand repeat-containing protein, partial [Luteolibacter sp.]|nr:autotransporter-associated beta strand repeat-containing protein [Luteolibacter sp.]
MKPKTTPARRNVLALAGTITVLFSLPTAQAADRNKANNTTNLNLAGSWDTLPGIYDVATWTSVVTGANTSLLGADLNWLGIKITNPGGLVTIGSGNTLTLGAQGINMSAATQDLTIQSGLALQKHTGQIWNINTGRVLTLNTGTFTRNRYSTLNVQGLGTVTTSNIFNNATGIIGPWATFGTGTSAKFATVNGSNNIVGYSGTAAATAAAVTDTTGLVNYDVAAVGAFGAGASFNTLRYTGAAGTITGNYSANGILTAGTGAPTLSGNLTIGNTRELVLTNGDNNAARALTLSGIISDNASGPSGITKTGEGIVKLSGNNTYTGITTVNRGRVELGSNNGLGSPDAGTRLSSIGVNNSDGGNLNILNGVNTPEPIFLDSSTADRLFYGVGTNEVSGPFRFNVSVRMFAGTNTTFSGGFSTTGGANGSQIIVNAPITITNKPFINGSGSNGSFYMDSAAGQYRNINVAGSIWGTTVLGNGILRTG